MSLLHGMQRSLDRARIHSVIWQARLSPRNVTAADIELHISGILLEEDYNKLLLEEDN